MPQYDLAGNPLPESASSSSPRTDLAGNPLPAAPAVRYDLAGNPLPASAPPTPVYAPAPGMANAGTIWPPPPSPASRASWQEQQRLNTSGQQGDAPSEIAALKWNWGAFSFYRLWCYKHGMTTLASIMWGSLYVMRHLGGFMPQFAGLIWVTYMLLDYGLAIYFGLSGHKLGWRNRRFEGGVEEFFKVQRAWMIWGLLWQIVQVTFFVWLLSLVV